MSGIEACRNCGALLQGNYCHDCGQKRFTASDQTLRALLATFLAALTELDGRLLRTLRELFSRPGHYLDQYLHGARRRYIAPVALFLSVNVAYFFLTVFNDLSMPLGQQWIQWYGAYARELVDWKLSVSGMTRDELAAEYLAETRSLAKTLIILHVPLFAIGLKLLDLRGHRLYASHVQVAFVYTAMVLLFFVLVPVVLTVAIFLWESIGLPDVTRGLAQSLGRLVLAAGALWLTLDILRRCYRRTWIWSLLFAPLVILLFALVHAYAYRPLLFLVTLWLI